MERLIQQMNFIIEVDKLKSVFRRSFLVDGTRRENDAEHSWHLALMVMILAEHSNVEIDVLKTIKMVMIHDLVEIYAGDTYAYDEKGNENKYDREKIAASKIFGMLPKDQGLELRELWEEFEARNTAESQFAAGIDRIQPILLNYESGGQAWTEHDISINQVLKRNEHTKEGSDKIWDYIYEVIQMAAQKGYLQRD